MVTLPHRARQPSKSQLTSHCQWCCSISEKKKLFKLVDGPVEHWFCDKNHAELWLEFRHKAKTYHLCRMLPQERAAALAGRTMEQQISILYSELCDHSPS